jgi:hypothetical protein
MTTMKALTRRSLMDKAVKGAGLAIAAIIGLPIDHLIPSGIQRAYSLLALGGPNLPDTGPVSALKFGADGVPVNDANGGLFGNAFPFLNTPNAGNK